MQCFSSYLLENLAIASRKRRVRNDAGSTSGAKRSVPRVKDQFCHHNRSDDNKLNSSLERVFCHHSPHNAACVVRKLQMPVGLSTY
eukprot:6834497-Pyramimonas_sp.AAC.1